MHSFQHAAQNLDQASRMLHLSFSPIPSLRFFFCDRSRSQSAGPSRRLRASAPARCGNIPTHHYCALHVVCIGSTLLSLLTINATGLGS